MTALPAGFNEVSAAASALLRWVAALITPQGILAAVLSVLTLGALVAMLVLLLCKKRRAGFICLGGAVVCAAAAIVLLLTLPGTAPVLPTIPTETEGPTETVPPPAQTSSAAQLTAADTSYWDACDKHMFTAPDTAVRTEPWDKAPVGRTLSGWTVRVCAVVWADNTEPWALVTFFTFDSAVNNIGWVRWSSLIEYTAETREALRYPVGVAEGAHDSVTGALIWPADGEFALEYRDGAAYLTREGGEAWTVKPEDVVFPEV